MAHFVRVTQHLINLDNIDEVVEGGENLSKVHMISGRQISLSAEEHVQLVSQMAAFWGGLTPALEGVPGKKTDGVNDAEKD